MSKGVQQELSRRMDPERRGILLPEHCEERLLYHPELGLQRILAFLGSSLPTESGAGDSKPLVVVQ
jgi:hypothetical protein